MRYLDLGTGNASVLQMTCWALCTHMSALRHTESRRVPRLLGLPVDRSHSTSGTRTVRPAPHRLSARTFGTSSMERAPKRVETAAPLTHCAWFALPALT